MKDLTALRNEMVQKHLVARDIRDPSVIEAMQEVPREAFVPRELVEFAYADSPLPIDEGQTISQPYIVALMTEALELSAGDRVLEIGTGSGYAAAILGRIAAEVYTVERHASLARVAEERFRRLGYENIHVVHGDGSLGLPEHAPYNAVVVTAGGPKIPEPLKDQLAVGGRLVMPVGDEPRLQTLLRVRRVSEREFQSEDLGDVQFVPLIGAAGWMESETEDGVVPPPVSHEAPLPEIIRHAVEPVTSIQDVDLNGLLARIGDARVVLLGEASHGTAEFYEMRARITKELIERRGFNIVAVEADWPDAARIDHYVRNTSVEPSVEKPFSRFPGWMWANEEVMAFVGWLREHNRNVESPEHAAGFFGLDLYSLHSSIGAVLNYLEKIDPETARIARLRYGCLTPWQKNPASYGAAALSGRYRECEPEVVAMLKDLLSKQLEYAARDSNRFLDALQNARLVTNAERYYRIMYYGSYESWNLRDRHMFETLMSLLMFHGPDARAVVWEHNSHIGDASATEMGAKGEQNVGQFCREEFGQSAYLVGFGTDHGTVAAASDWDGPMEVKKVRPSHAKSYERLCHESGVESFLLPLRTPIRGEVRSGLLKSRLERAIGVVYQPETELQSHYFYATLPRQFDEYIWIDETHAVTPLRPEAAEGMPETFPFGL